MVIPSQVSVDVGGSQKIKCNASVDNVVWTLEGSRLPINVQTGITAKHLHHIKIKNATTRNKGEYMCSVNNNYAIFEDSCYVEVKGEGKKYDSQ